MELIINMTIVAVCVFMGVILGAYSMFMLMFHTEQHLLTELDCKNKIIENYDKKKKAKQQKS
jgi:hypothetical protein